MARILVVEDTLSNIKLAQLVLEHAGHQVLVAEDGPGGLLAARQHLPDLILMDVQLPGMDGMAVTRELKADPATARIPVLALTAFAMKGDAEKIRAAGCDAYLAKPFQFPELVKTIERLLAGRP
ncbi:MAG: response regulator [Burkholderiales bacterium]|nr:response regulator [Burkholderiales bacterium]